MWMQERDYIVRLIKEIARTLARLLFHVDIAAASARSPEYVSRLGELASLLTDGSSYVRTRAFILCCCQARWAAEGQLAAVLPEMLPLLSDPKPTVVRQCLKAVQDVVRYRPELRKTVREALDGVDLSRYRDSMAPLIGKDIQAVRDMPELRGDAG